MNEEINSFTLKRDYVKGTIYEYGDLVEYNGSSYLALQEGKLPAPSDTTDKWYELNSRSTFYRTTIKPKFAEHGDKWFDPSSGVLYTRVKQPNGVMFWIEL